MEYIIGNEYEFSDDKIAWAKGELVTYDNSGCYSFECECCLEGQIILERFQHCRAIQTTTQKKAIEAYSLNQRSEYSQAVWDAGEVIDNCPTASAHNTSYEKSLAMKATVVSLINAGWRKQ